MSKEQAMEMGALCDECPLKNSPIVYGRGPFPAQYILVGESPGATEVRLGKPFVGPSGKLLERTLQIYQSSLDEQRVTNAVLCHPPRNVNKETVLTKARRCCGPRLREEIELSQPEVIISLGRYAMESLVGSDQGGIMTIRGKFLEVESLQAPVMPTVHPAAVLRRPDLFVDFRTDIGNAIQPVERDLVFPIGPESYDIIDNVTDAVTFILGDLARQPKVVIDLETSGFSMIDDLILCAVFCWDVKHATVIEGHLLYRPEVQGALRQVFDGEGRIWIGHGAKFDKAFLEGQIGTSPHLGYDTLMAHYAIDERRGTHDLKVLSRILFQAPDWEGDLKKYLPKPKIDSYALLPKAVLYKYSAHDGVYTWRLYLHLQEQLSHYAELQNLLDNILVPAQNALAYIEVHGVTIDTDYAETLQDDMEAELFRLEDELVELGGNPDLNPNSPKQVAKILYDDLKLPTIKGQGRSTNAKYVLPRLMEAHPFVPVLAAYRTVSKLYSTYVNKLPGMIASDGNVHGSFMVHGTVTGRLASRGPNLQNIPRDSSVKNLFSTAAGNVLVMGDYSQAEFRMLGYYSQDEFLLKVFRAGKDLHGETTAIMFGEPYTKEQRVIGKMVNFGLTYGRSEQAMANDIRLPGMDAYKARTFIKNYFGRMPKARAWMKDVNQAARTRGHLSNAFGRRRRFPLITQANRAEVERQAVNFMCQSTASDITLLSLIELQRIFSTWEDVDILLTVHDSILVECPIGKVDDVAAKMVEVMELVPRQTLGPSMPFTVDIAVGHRWGSLVDYDEWEEGSNAGPLHNA